MPGGRPKGARDAKPITEAIMIALKREDKGTRTKKMQRLADRLVRIALDDSPMHNPLPAMKEIMDRIEGKPAQTIAGDPDKPHELVIRVIDPTKGKI